MVAKAAIWGHLALEFWAWDSTTPRGRNPWQRKTAHLTGSKRKKGGARVPVSLQEHGAGTRLPSMRLHIRKFPPPAKGSRGWQPSLHPVAFAGPPDPNYSRVSHKPESWASGFGFSLTASGFPCCTSPGMPYCPVHRLSMSTAPLLGFSPHSGCICVPLLAPKCTLMCADMTLIGDPVAI